MCRAVSEGGRRCPGCSDPANRERAAVRQRIGRYSRACARHYAAGDDTKGEHYAAMLERDIAEYERITTVDMPPVVVTQAADFTPARTVDWSDDELVAEVARHHDDPAAQDQILQTLEHREQLAVERDVEVAAMRAEQERVAQRSVRTWDEEAAVETGLTMPALRAGRSLTPDERCREAYTAYTYEQYLAAEDECRGELVSRAGKAAGVDPQTLFSGPAHVAAKYASEELKTWWGRNGRLNATQFRYAYLGRDSDREAARTSARQSLGEAAA